MTLTHWTELSDRLLAPAIARLGCRDLRLLELVVPDATGVAGAPDLAELRRCAPATTAALTMLLADPWYRHAVKALVIAARSVPEPLLRPMLMAAARTLNPSANQYFVIPCTLTFGRRRVLTTLLDIAMEPGPLQSGAVNALYWAWTPREHLDWPFAEVSASPSTPDDPADDLRAAFLAWAVGEFIDNDTLDLRRALASYVVDARHHEPALATRAIALGLAHEDGYIRQRVAVGLGEGGPLPCLPGRAPD